MRVGKKVESSTSGYSEHQQQSDRKSTIATPSKV